MVSVLEIIGGSLTSLICDLSLEKANNKLTGQQDRKQLSDRVNVQIKNYEKDIFLNLREDEQFDLEKVNQYIKEHLFDKVSACFNLPEAYQRELARKNLIDTVYCKAGADTAAKKKTVYHYLQIFLQIVNFYYLEKIDDREWFLAGKTVEEAAALVEKYIKESENRIVDAIRYHGSFAEYIDGIGQSQDNTNAFHYRNELLKFQGRETELKILNEFIEDDEALSWMAVTGPGGAGKSKLLYHFTKDMEIYPKWKSVWIHTENCEQFIRFNEWRYPCNLLIVIDYAGTVASDAGKWMERLERSRYRPDKVRFVFIEREGIEKNGSVPLWYQNLKGSGEQARCVERLGWKKYDGTPFLQLPALESDQLEKIIEDYAEMRKKVLSDEQKRWILAKAEEIDRKQGKPRVLIVIFTADAVLEGREYKQWDIQHLIDEIIKKYSEHWKKVSCRNDEKIFSALSEMLMFSTATGAWEPENKAPGLFENSSSVLCSLDSADLEQLISEVNEEKRFEGKLKPLEPDLIGEYYVLDYWTKKKYNREYLEKIFCTLWEYPLNFAQFLNRCVQNYMKQGSFQYLFQNGMKRLMPLENDGFEILLFSMLLVNLIVEQTEEEAIESVSRLEELSGKYEGNEEIALEYAKGLFNLSNKQEEAGAKESISRLEELSGKYEGNEEIALAYAKGLFILSCNQDESKRRTSLKRLDELRKKYKLVVEWFIEFFRNLNK